MTRKLYTILATLAILTNLSAQTANGQYYQWLPLIETTAPPFCTMQTDANLLWIDITGTIEKDNPLYVYNHVWPENALVYHAGNEGKHIIGQKELAPAMAIRWLEGGAGYKTECSIGEPFRPGRAAPITILDFAQVHVHPYNEHEAYCGFWGAETLSVHYTQYNPETRETNSRLWFTKTANYIGNIPLSVDCGGQEWISPTPPNVITQVDFVHDGKTTTRYSKDFYRFWQWLPSVAR